MSKIKKKPCQVKHATCVVKSVNKGEAEKMLLKKTKQKNSQIRKFR